MQVDVESFSMADRAKYLNLQSRLVVIDNQLATLQAISSNLTAASGTLMTGEYMTAALESINVLSSVAGGKKNKALVEKLELKSAKLEKSVDKFTRDLFDGAFEFHNTSRTTTANIQANGSCVSSSYDNPEELQQMLKTHELQIVDDAPVPVPGSETIQSLASCRSSVFPRRPSDSDEN